jgi:hypothetical protein
VRHHSRFDCRFQTNSKGFGEKICFLKKRDHQENCLNKLSNIQTRYFIISLFL